MLNRVIEFSIRHRFLVVCAAVFLLVYGAGVVSRMPVDVLPDLNRPVVTVLTEAHGLAPEETETLVTFPIETMMNGASGVQRVRSASSAGLSIVWVEFGWGTEIFRARQIVNEKLQLAQARLPQGTIPALGPISSIMGEIMLISLSSKDGTTPPLEVRSLADWVVRPRLLAVPGVSQVVPIGGGTKQYQVLTNPARLQQYGVTLEQLLEAAKGSNQNTTGGFLQSDAREAVVRIMGRARSLEDIARSVVTVRNGVPVTIGQVADVRLGKPLARGDASVSAEPAVILSVQKQPNANTLELTRTLDRALNEVQASLPADVQVNRHLFRQSEFIETAVRNVEEALRDGTVLVFLILMAFLLCFRATFISLTAIPLSFLVAMLVLDYLGISVNTMTLGGLAVAIGLVVDDSIVDVENVFRRLKENRLKPNPDPPLQVIYHASAEVRNSIVFATLIILVVFVPLVSLEGMEGRVFMPLGLAFMIALSASLLVSLTVTPALCAILLGKDEGGRACPERSEGMKDEKGPGSLHPSSFILHPSDDPWLVRHVKRLDAPVVRWAIRHSGPVIAVAVVMVVVAGSLFAAMGREFLPPFNEGSMNASVILPPGTSLAESNRIAALIEKQMLAVPGVAHTGRRTGRAEMDEHAEGVGYSEIDIGLKPNHRPMKEIQAEIRDRMKQFPGVVVALGQPISHRLDHLSSGVRAALAVKVYGPDLQQLRRRAEEVRGTMAQVAGIVDLQVEPQVEVPEIHVSINRDAAARYGLQPAVLAETLEAALNGETVSQILQGQRTYDLVVWFDEASRNNLDVIRGTLVETPTGARIPLGQLADVTKRTGPNTINRENVSRRIVVQANVQGQDLNSVVTDLQARMRPVQAGWGPGYFVEYGGQFESQQAAMSRILFLGVFTVVAIFLLLYMALGSWRLALQVMVNLPLAMVGGVIAVFLTGGVLSVASLVGFITLFGIATRNGIMMISHYEHLMREEGEPFGEAMIMRGTLERLPPVLMTALAAAIGLLPIALSVGQPGKELLQPIAVVILGGLISSTFLDQMVTPALFYLVGAREFGKGKPHTRRLEYERRQELRLPEPVLEQ